MKQINRLLLIVVSLAMLVFSSCAEGYKSKLEPDKPSGVSMSEYLNGYDVLKNYIDRATYPNFKLGAIVDAGEFLKEDIVYSLMRSNFDQLTVTNVLTHGATVSKDGAMNFSQFDGVKDLAEKSEVSILGHTLNWHAQQNNTYLNDIIAPIPGEITTGVTKVYDFESSDLGDSYPMTGNGFAKVVNDPAGKSGKVLNVGGPANWSFPILPVVLPEGMTLGDYKTVTLDFNGTGATGLYGGGMQMAIDDPGVRIGFDSPAVFGCPNGGWGRGLIILDMAKMNLTPQQKLLTQFDLIVGSGTGSGDYYIDNITMEWEKGHGEYVRPDEEKKEILLEAMDAWIGGVMESNGGVVSTWDVVTEPMSDDDNYMLRSAENEADPLSYFYWADYLGENYVRDVVKLARQKFKEFDGNEGELKLFVNEYGLEKHGKMKCQRLITMLNKWEEDGTKIDGVGTQMHLTYSLDPTQQMNNESGVVNMFTALAATGKLIRISAIDMNVVDVEGVMVESSHLTAAQQFAMAEYYNFIIRKYFEIIPESQRYGITHGCVIDKSATEPVGLWNRAYNRKPTYIGFADGLAGKESIAK